MTHADIIKKFMIEYDKANVTSSFPSLTKYEICTLLDKAYLALISLKITGANTRKAPFESDIKSVEDVRPLIRRSRVTEISTYVDDQGYNLYSAINTAPNEKIFPLPEDVYYVIGGMIQGVNGTKWQNMVLMPHANADNFKVTDTNLPWIKTPIFTLEDTFMYVYIDKYVFDQKHDDLLVEVTYIKMPNKFVDTDLESIFELDDGMAEELISLAIVFALETIESTRLTTKTNTLSLES